MTKNNKKNLVASKQQNPQVMLLLGLVFAGITYGFASWAIDSGAIPLYMATFISAYMTLRSIVNGVKQFIRK